MMKYICEECKFDIACIKFGRWYIEIKDNKCGICDEINHDIFVAEVTEELYGPGGTYDVSKN